MSEREDRARLQHMLDASRQAIAFVQGRRRDELDRDLRPTLALTRLVEIVGEAASVAFRIGALGTGSPGTTLIPRCRSHAEEFRIMLQRFMRPDTWSEQTISRK